MSPEQRSGLDLTRIRFALQGSVVGQRIDYHRTIDSTMPRAMELANARSTVSGTVVLAEEQFAGQGRRGRLWEAPFATSLLASVIFKEPMPDGFAGRLAMVAGIAVTDAIAVVCPQLRERLRLKWPNDVVVLAEETPAATERTTPQGLRIRKVGGILVQAAYQGTTPVAAIAGIGLNVNQQAEELPTVQSLMLTPSSLRLETNEQIEREALFIQLCASFEQYLLSSEARTVVFDRWRERLATLGEQVNVYTIAGQDRSTIQGVAEDVSETGDLLVRDCEGVLHKVSAGDVIVRNADECDGEDVTL